MNKLKSIMAYFCMNYPYKHELSKARLTKLVYLADWFSSLKNERQFTDINWVFNHYGPYVSDVTAIAAFDNNFDVISERTIYGGEKHLILYHGDGGDIELSDSEKAILDFIINKTKSMYFNSFIDYVYSTYPVTSNERYSELDLPRLAREYKSSQEVQVH